MKKILSLVLAVLMLTSIAFATTDMVWKPAEGDQKDSQWLVYPGAKIQVAEDIMTTLWTEWDHAAKYTRADAKYFDVKIDFAKGEDMIKSQGWDGNKYVVEVKDFDEITDWDDDVVVNSITVKLKKDSKNHFIRLVKDYVEEEEGDFLVFDAGKFNGDAQDAASWGTTDAARAAEWDVGYNYYLINDEPAAEGIDIINDFDGKWKGDIGVFGADLENTPYYKNTSDPKAALDITLSDLVEGDDDLALDVDFSLKAGQWFMMTPYYNGREDYDDMEDAFDELTKDAEYAYLFGFEGSTLKSKATFTLGADEDAFIYAIDKDGKISESGFKWDDDDEAWKKTTRDLGGCYILSDIELAAAPAADTTNPDTGANDIVGIASALAVVAVISAAAISLKK